MYTKGETNTFQMVLLGVFAFLILAGVIAFATFRGSSSTDLPPLTVWGTVPEQTFDDFLNNVSVDLKKDIPITYTSFRVSDFDGALTEALAADRGPDMILLPQDLIVRHYDKVYVLPYSSYSARDFKDTFVQEGEMYLTPQGIIAFPFSLDPLVLYWNRTLFSNAGLATPPAYWDELANVVNNITTRDPSGNILRSGVALGEFANVSHAKQIVATLMMQAGGQIIAGTPGNLSVPLTDTGGNAESPAASALRFYTEFANPTKALYSWNRSLPLSENAFLAGDLALYPGFASELSTLRQKNPNLNYDVTTLPQVRGAAAKMTFGRMYGLAVMKRSSNINAAFSAIGLLTSPDVLGEWETMTGLPPVRRDMLSQKQGDAYKQVFYDSALISTAFLDPSPQQTDGILKNMIENITSGRLSVSESLQNTQAQLETLLK